MAKTLAVNAGSSSLKFQLLEMPEEHVVAQGIVERIGFEMGEITIKYGNVEPTRIVGTDKATARKNTAEAKGEKFNAEEPFANHEEAINAVLKQLIDLGIINDFNEITGVGHRVVAGGELFNKSVVINEDVLEKIENLKDYAPLHNPANAIGIRAFEKLIPDALQVAVFDTSFHQTIPEENYLYPLPYEYYTKYGVRKYGAHGTSHRYVSERAAEILGKPIEELRIVSMHLGAGASVTAIKNGKSFDTSMGFTPLAGLMMASRSGDVDPSLLYYVQEKEHLSNDEMLDVLNNKSGMLGVSSISADMRDLEDVQETNSHAKLALKMFEERAAKYMAQYIVAMGGADAIVFTAGIGENSPETREHLLEKLAFMGVKVDTDANHVRGKETVITTKDSSVTGLLIPTNEELMIARDVESLKK